MQTSARYGVQYPSADRTDAPDVATHLINIVTGLEQSAMYGQGPIASRPTSTVGVPGKQGRLYASTDEVPNRLYYDYGTGWFQVGALAAGAVGTTELADAAVTLAKLAANSVDSSKIVDGSIVSADIADGTITAADIAAALKPSAGAGAATEALRALGTAAGLAAAGTHASQHQPGGADVLTLEGRQVNKHVGAAPPGSPQDGDEWILPLSSPDGEAGYWRFTYDSSEATYKWKFAGGMKLIHYIETDQQVNGPAQQNLTTYGPYVSIPRSGVYTLTAAARVWIGGDGDAYMNMVETNAADVVQFAYGQFKTDNGSRGVSNHHERRVGVTGGNRISLRYASTGGTPAANFAFRHVSAIPVKVI